MPVGGRSKRKTTIARVGDAAVAASLKSLSLTQLNLNGKFLTQEEEMQQMKENEKYGFLHRVDYRQEDFKKDLVRVREEIAREASADRKARRKSFQKAVLGVDSQDLQ